MRPPIRRPLVLLARSVGPCGACPCSTPTTDGGVKCYQKWLAGQPLYTVIGFGFGRPAPPLVPLVAQLLPKRALGIAMHRTFLHVSSPGPGAGGGTNCGGP